MPIIMATAIGVLALAAVLLSVIATVQPGYDAPSASCGTSVPADATTCPPLLISGSERGSMAVEAASRWLGTPYSYGGGGFDGPTTGIGLGAKVTGFDCSGLVRYAWHQAGIALPRTAEEQWQTIPHVPPGHQAPGDLVFFQGSGGGPDHPGHVGLVLGPDRMIEARAPALRFASAATQPDGTLWVTPVRAAEADLSRRACNAIAVAVDVTEDGRSSGRRTVVKAVAKWAGGTLAALVALLVLLASPFALGQVADMTGVDWASLANVGDAYGSAVALLTAVSLLMLAVSVAFQARTARISSETTVRMLHVEMLRFTIEDPTLMQVGGARWDGSDESAEEMRMWAYANMQLALLRSFYALKETTTAELRLVIAGRFSSRIGREHWEFNRTWYRASERNRRDRRFGEIVEEEYQRAIQAGEALKERPRKSQDNLPSRDLVVGAVAAVIAVGVGVLLGQRRSSRL